MRYLIAGLLLAAIAGYAAHYYYNRPAPDLMESSHTILITSSVFREGESMPSRYTCDGDNINPPLSIGEMPVGARFLVLIMDDPDAPNGTWVHWVKFDIPKTKEIEEGKEPTGISGKGSGGKLIYQGPCPPNGEHRYFFKVYALDAALSLAEGASKEDVEAAMQGHILGQGSLMGKYSR